MTDFTLAHAEGDSWSAIAKDLEHDLADLAEPGLGEARIGFLYATDVLADDLSSLLTSLRQCSGVEHWAGSLGLGICAGRQEYFDRPAAAVLVATFPENAFRVLPSATDSDEPLSEEVRDWVAAESPPFGVVHGDPMNGEVPWLVEALSQALENTALDVPGFLVGGLTSSRGPHHQIAGTVTQGGLSGVLFAPGVEVATALTQGCTPVAEAHQVSEGMDNVIMSLDGEPALEVFKRDIGELLARDLARVAGYIHAAFPVVGSDTGDYVVRNLVGVDPEHGWLAVGGEVATGDRVMFVRRDPKSAEKDLVRMAENLKRRLPDRPRGGLYFSCVARGPGMFGKEGREMEIIHEVLGDIPLVGFYGQGEISNNRLYGYTGVLALFL